MRNQPTVKLTGSSQNRVSSPRPSLRPSAHALPQCSSDRTGFGVVLAVLAATVRLAAMVLAEVEVLTVK